MVLGLGYVTSLGFKGLYKGLGLRDLGFRV